MVVASYAMSVGTAVAMALTTVGVQQLDCKSGSTMVVAMAVSVTAATGVGTAMVMALTAMVLHNS